MGLVTERGQFFTSCCYSSLMFSHRLIVILFALCINLIVLSVATKLWLPLDAKVQRTLHCVKEIPVPMCYARTMLFLVTSKAQNHQQFPWCELLSATKSI